MLSILVSLSLIGALAPGAEAREPRPPLIQVGAGAESSNARSIAALVQIRFRGISDNGGDPEAHPATGTFLMRISGDLAVGPRADEAGAWDVPRFNVELTTVTFGVGEEAAPNGRFRLEQGEIRITPMRMNRNINLDNAIGMSIDVIGIQTDFATAVFEERGWLTYIKLAADGLGFKLLASASDQGMFLGGRLAVGRVELGQVLQMSPGNALRFAIGGEGDLSLGVQALTRQAGFNVRSDFEAYGEVSLDVAHYVRLFARGAIAGNWNDLTGEVLHEYRLTAGALFVFDPVMNNTGAVRR